MSHSIIMNVDQIFLSNAKISLDNLVDDATAIGNWDSNVVNSVTLIISCFTALEAFLNKIYINNTNLYCFDQLKFEGKIETLHNIHSKAVAWGENPYQTIRELITIRNWLVHFKKSYIGELNINTNGVMDRDGKRVPLSKDPFEIFTKKSCFRYYEQTKAAICDLAKLVNLDDFDYNFAKSEEFDYFVIG